MSFHLISSHVMSCLAGIDNVELYTETHFGTKMLIHDFIQQVRIEDDGLYV